MSDEPSRFPEYRPLATIDDRGKNLVLRALQESMEREVALKTPKDAGKGSALYREAQVIGGLEHPNIIPIYDRGQTHDGSAFYSMKFIKGRPWSEKIDELGEENNLEILLRVADAIAFAHSKDVSHLDLKPENIMLGEFGEVQVTDWGIAKSPLASARPGERGTASYAAPELAKGRYEELGPHSDIYLLGALLFRIVTGRPPHNVRGKDRRRAMWVAAKNIIQTAGVDESHELLNIARQAMATDPAGRFATVRDFQQAIRGYREHRESLALTAKAEQVLEQSRGRNDYQLYTQATVGFQDALMLWPENEPARQGLNITRLEHAACARVKGDLELAESLLSDENPEHARLLEEIRAQARHRRDREKVVHRLKKQAFWSMAAGVVIGLGLSAWLLGIMSRLGSMRRELRFTQGAVESVEKALTQANVQLATASQKLAGKNEELEERNRKLENTNARLTDAQVSEQAARRRADEETYISLIRATKTLIDDKSFEAAKKELNDCPASYRNWEWYYLRDLCEEHVLTLQMADPRGRGLQTVTLDPDGNGVFAAGGNDSVWHWQPAAADRQPARLPAALTSEKPPYVFASAIVQGKGKNTCLLAVGCNEKDRQLAGGVWQGGYLKVWRYDARPQPDGVESRGTEGPPTPQTTSAPQTAASEEGAADPAGSYRPLLPDKFVGHRDAVVSVEFSRCGRWLLSSSYDGTARLWDTENGETLVRLPNIDPRDGNTIWSARFVECPAGPEAPQPAATGTDQPGDSAGVPLEAKIVTVNQEGNVVLWKVSGSPKRPADSQITSRYAEIGEPLLATALSEETCELVVGSRSGYLYSVDLGEGGDASRGLPVRKIPVVRHQGPVYALCCAPSAGDGARRLLASGGGDNLIRVWNGQTGETVHTLRGHSGPVFDLKFSPDGRYIYSASQDGFVKKWDLKKLPVEHTVVQREAPIFTAAFSGDGRSIIAACQDRCTVVQRNWQEGGDQVELEEGHAYLLERALYLPSPDARHSWQGIATSGLDGTIRFWNASTGGQAGLLTDTGGSGAFDVSRNGRWLVAAGGSSADRQSWPAQVYQLGLPGTFARKQDLEPHLGEVTAIAFSPTTNDVFTGDAKGHCRMWRVDPPGLRWGNQDRHWAHEGTIVDAQFRPDGQELLAASLDHSVTRWNVRTGEPGGRRLWHQHPILSLDISPNGKWAVTCCTDGKVRIWEIDQSRCVARLTVPEDWSQRTIRRARFSRRSDPLRVVGIQPETGRTMIWSLKEMPGGTPAVQPFSEPPANVLNIQPLRMAAFNPRDDELLVVGGTTGLRWDQVTGRVTQRFGQHDLITAACLSADASLAVTADGQGMVKVWNVTAGKTVDVWSHPQGVNTLHLVTRKDQFLLLAACADGSVGGYKLDGSGTRLAEPVVLPPQPEGAKSFVLGGTLLLQCGRETGMHLWDFPSQQLLATVGSNAVHDVQCAAYCQSGGQELLATGGEANTAWVWNVVRSTSARPPAEVPPGPVALSGHTDGITSIAFSPDGSRVVTGSKDEMIKIWETASGRELLTLRQHSGPMTTYKQQPGPITSVAFSRDGKTLLSSSSDGSTVVRRAVSFPAAGDPPAQVAATRVPVADKDASASITSLID